MPLVFTISCRATTADLLSCSLKRLRRNRHSKLKPRWESSIAIVKIAQLLSLRILHKHLKSPETVKQDGWAGT